MSYLIFFVVFEILSELLNFFVNDKSDPSQKHEVLSELIRSTKVQNVVINRQYLSNLLISPVNKLIGNRIQNTDILKLYI